MTRILDAKHPTLSKAVESGQVVLLLGAGASKDYGLPTWQELKPKIGETISSGNFDELVGIDTIKTWLVDWANGDTRTVDQKVRASDDADINRTFQKIVTEILLRGEAKGGTGTWIGSFNKVVSELVRNIAHPQKLEQLLTRLRFVTLNYDRVFEHYYSQSVHLTEALASVLGSTMDAQAFMSHELEKHLEIVHPHGVIGYLPQKDNFAKVQSPGFTRFSESIPNIGFGELEHGKPEAGSSIMVVDHATFGKNTSYDQANQILSETKTIFCLGLSKDGFEAAIKAKLRFAHSSTIWFWSPEKALPACPSGCFLQPAKGKADDFVRALTSK